MIGFPLDVYRHIREFVLPIRYDWRTCKAHEANLIWEEYMWRLHTPNRRFYQEEVDEVRSWGLYGVLLSDRLYIGQDRRPLIPPSEAAYQDDPREWYRHRLMWVSDGGE